MRQERSADVAIVGAGLAGLMAARRIVEAGVSVVVLEARSRVGGRTLNQGLGDGKVVEMGGQWIGPTQDRMYALAAELGIETFPTYLDGEEVAIIGRKRYRYRGEIPRMNPLVLADLAQATARLDRLARRVPVERPWDASKAAEWDAQTFAAWLRRSVATPRARSIVDAYLSTILAAETAGVSLLHALFYIHSGTNFRVLTTGEGGAQQDRFVGGSQLVAIRLAERLGDVIELDAPARRILQGEDGVRVETDRLTVRARAAIVAVPPTLAARIAYDPPLPPERDQLLQRLPQGTVIKVNVVYDEPFWRPEGLKGFAWSPEQPVTIIVDNSPPEGSPGVIAGFIKGNNARRLGREEPEARRKLVLETLARYLGKKAVDPDAYHELDWTTEVWTRGCFGAHFPPGIWTQYGSFLREPAGLIHWAGTETSPVWNGYMEGAVRSGDRAAGEILADLG